MSKFQMSVEFDKYLTRMIIEGNASGATALIVEGVLKATSTVTPVRSYSADLTSALTQQDIQTIQSFWTRAQAWLDSQPNT